MLSRLTLSVLTLVLSLAAQAQAPIGFSDDFSRYGATWSLAEGWTVMGGKVRVEGNALRTAGTGQVIAYPVSLAESGEQIVEVTVSPVKRLAPGGWSALGLCIYSDPANFWRLALVDPPNGPSYCELVEMRDGVWQAQEEAGTRLAALPDSVGHGWRYGASYRLRLRLEPSRIVGEVFEGDVVGTLVYRHGFFLPVTAPDLCSIDPARRGPL